MRHNLWLILAILIVSSQSAFADGKIPLAITNYVQAAAPVKSLLYQPSALLAENKNSFNDESIFFNESPTYFNDTEYAEENAAITANDPFEGWNRIWFNINDWLYIDVGKPAHAAYRVVVPKLARDGFNNLVINWFGMPRRFINAILQAKFALAGIEFSRFVVNTAFGFGGLMDIAKNLNPVIPHTGKKEDFGQTLGTWGIPAGPYLILPFFGASNLRDTTGLMVGALLPPSLSPAYLNYVLFASSQFNNLDKRITVYENIVGTAVEPYISLRNAYSQLRKTQIEN